ncbi:hypothetical protein, partial [Kaistella solincola]|uniref:hypothetical protein n=1 Tax=Kaistella solincola TaxID=510955 RepID=UPI001C88347B
IETSGIKIPGFKQVKLQYLFGVVWAFFFGADISCYPLLLLGWRLRFAPPPPCGVAASITAAVFRC